MFAPYNDAILRFFRRLKWPDKSIPVVYAGPDRAHGQMKRYLASRTASSTGRDFEEVLKEIDEASIPRPFVSVFLDNAGYDPLRFSTFVHRKIVVDEVEGTALSVQEPRPENFTVQADIWCGDDWHCAGSLIFQLKSMFSADDVPILVDFGESKYYTEPYHFPAHCQLMGQLTCRLVDEGVSDNSQYEGGREAPKDIRKTFSGTLYGWLPRMPFKGKLIRRFEYQVFDDTGDPPVLLETTTVDLDL
jgi:hypothetical protein